MRGTRKLQGNYAAKWIGTHIRISVPISSNVVKESFFFSNSDPQHLVTSLTEAFEDLAIQSRVFLKKLFFVIEATTKVKLGSILEKLTQLHNRREQAGWMLETTKFVAVFGYYRSKRNC